MTTEEIDQLVDEVKAMSRDDLVAEVKGHVGRVWGADMVAKVDKYELLELRWSCLVYRAQAPYPMDPAGRQQVNRELDAAGLQWPYPPGSKPSDRAKHRLA